MWNGAAGFETAYLSRHPGFYTTGDAGFVDEDGFVHVMSRIDDIINVAGHRISTGVRNPTCKNRYDRWSLWGETLGNTLHLVQCQNRRDVELHTFFR